jgi:hypothetical protein
MERRLVVRHQPPSINNTEKKSLLISPVAPPGPDGLFLREIILIRDR